MDPNSRDVNEFSPESSYVDLRLTWADNLPKKVRFLVVTFLYTAEGSYIGRAAVLYKISNGKLRHHSLRLLAKSWDLRCFDHTSLKLDGKMAETVSWAVAGHNEPNGYALINGEISARNFISESDDGQDCTGTWRSIIEQSAVKRVKVAVHNYYEKTNLDNAVKIEWRIRPISGDLRP